MFATHMRVRVVQSGTQQQSHQISDSLFDHLLQSRVQCFGQQVVPLA